jgi:hypothetical protein
MLKSAVGSPQLPHEFQTSLQPSDRRLSRRLDLGAVAQGADTHTRSAPAAASGGGAREDRRQRAAASGRALVAAMSPVVFTGGVKIKLGDQTTDVDASFNAGQTATIPVGNDMTMKITPNVLPNGSVRYEMSVESGNPANGQPVKVLSTPTVVTFPGNGFGIGIGLGGSAGSLNISFTPKPAANP